MHCVCVVYSTPYTHLHGVQMANKNINNKSDALRVILDFILFLKENFLFLYISFMVWILYV